MPCLKPDVERVIYCVEKNEKRNTGYGAQHERGILEEINHEEQDDRKADNDAALVHVVMMYFHTNLRESGYKCFATIMLR